MFDIQNQNNCKQAKHSPVGSFIGNWLSGIPTFLAQPVAAGMERATKID